MVDLPWHDLQYLASGSSVQRAAFLALDTLRVFEILEPYHPLLAGTLPLGIDIPGSDLDIICEAPDLGSFARQVVLHFGSLKGFSIKNRRPSPLPAVIARFQFVGFPVEIFGQPLPVREQNAYRHMLVEARLLEIGGPQARAEIRRLKAAGLKTEPAFARFFGLPGDPYETLLQLAELDESELRRRVQTS